MKPLMILGAVLIVAGIAILVIGQLSVQQEETLLQLGDAELTAETTETIPLPPLAGIVAVIAGVALVVASRFRKS